jgi:hypothetical protein
MNTFREKFVPDALKHLWTNASGFRLTTEGVISVYEECVAVVWSD